MQEEFCVQVGPIEILTSKEKTKNESLGLYSCVNSTWITISTTRNTGIILYETIFYGLINDTYVQVKKNNDNYVYYLWKLLGYQTPRLKKKRYHKEKD